MIGDHYVEFQDQESSSVENLTLRSQERIKYNNLESEFYSADYIRSWSSRVLPAYALCTDGIIVDLTIIKKSRNTIFVRDSYDQFVINDGILTSHPLSYISQNDKDHKRKTYGRYHNSWYNGEKIVKAILLDRIQNVSSVTNEETFVLSWHQDHTNYWHFLFETSFRLFALQQFKGTENLSNVNFVVIGQDLNSYQKEIFAALLKQKLSYILYPNGCHIKDCWMVPSSNCILNFQLLRDYSKSLTEGLIKNYKSITIEKNSYFSSVCTKSKRLYILRGINKNGRNITNEGDLLKLLKKYEFQAVDPGSLTIAKQAQIFREADIVIGAHGSAFANILYMDKGVVIELVGGSYDPIHDYFLAKAKNIRFLRLRSETQWLRSIPQHKDFECDLAKVMRALEIFC